jgi:hypothetical protein
MSGGKGGSQTQVTEIPKWIEEPSVRNLARAETAQKVGYMPWYGPDVASFSPATQEAWRQNIGASEAFGLSAPGSLTPMGGLPAPTTYSSGVTGYSGQPLYDQALAELKTNKPADVAQYNKLFV